MLVTVHGAALVPTGQSISDGENVIVRIVGPCKVRVDANSQAVAIGDMLFTANGSTDLITGSAQPDFVTAPVDLATTLVDLTAVQVLLKTKAVAREAATADNVLINAWMKGLPL